MPNGTVQQRPAFSGQNAEESRGICWSKVHQCAV